MPLGTKKPASSGIVTITPRRSIPGLSTEGSDFSLSVPIRRRANILICGEGGTGKTSFVTRFAPDPVALICYDGRSDYAVREGQQMGRSILFTEINFKIKRGTSKIDAQKLASDVVDKTLKNVEWAAEQSEKGRVRTLCLDTGTELTEIFDAAFDGSIGARKPVYGKDKDFINRQWWRIFDIVKDSKLHLVITSRAKEIFVENVQTGNQEATGRFTFKAPQVLNNAVHWAGHIRLKKGVKGKPKKEVELEIIKAGVRLSELGEVYDASDWDDYGGPFVYACWKQFEATSGVEDWL